MVQTAFFYTAFFSHLSITATLNKQQIQPHPQGPQYYSTRASSLLLSLP